MSVERRLMRESRAVRGHLALTVALGALNALLVIASAWLLARVIVQIAAEGATVADMTPELLALAGAFLVRGAVQWGFELSGRLGAERVMSDLRAGVVRLGKGFSRVYQAYLVAEMRRRVLRKSKRIPMPVDLDRLRQVKTFPEFDGLVTAPIHGFPDADDYYARCSAKLMLTDIEIPTLVIHAADDPLTELVNGHCINCHGPEDPKGELRLDRLDATFFGDVDQLETVIDMLQRKEMPPRKRKQPPDELRREAVALLRRRLPEHARAGRLKRLTREEYTNTINDL